MHSLMSLFPSKLNVYERGMALLSKVLTDLILPHGSCRTHSDKTDKEIDEEF